MNSRSDIISGLERLKDDIKWLEDISRNHASVDTYAKKLFFLGNDKTLKRLKNTISTFFVIEQARYPVDKRYDSFLASILLYKINKKPVLPANLKILNWNYDIQLEKAYYGFCEDNTAVTEKITFNNFLYHLNGYCGTIQPGHIAKTFTGVWDGTDSILNGIKLHNEYFRDPTSTSDIRFAWEDITQTLSQNTEIFSHISNITQIVVIGYSFPYFNRDIDRVIFSKMPTLERIYLQFPEDFQNSARDRIRTVVSKKIELIPITDLLQFYIPDNFN